MIRAITTDAIAVLIETLQSAQNGLQWYRDTYPKADSQADDEMHAQLDRCIHTLATAAAGADMRAARVACNLEGLRDALLNPDRIVRDTDGHYTNPAWPGTDEDVCFGTLARAFGVELQTVWAESQMTTDAYEAMIEAGHCRDWTPTPPHGDGWVLASIHDAEDGTVAWYVRQPAPTARPERTARFCPGCGSVGEVDAKYRDCCPDGGRARTIPEPLARQCHDLFQLALRIARPVDLVTILRTLRLKANKFPRFSFVMPPNGGVQRMKDPSGRWLDYTQVSELLDETCTDGLENELGIVATSLTQAASDVLSERRRQIVEEGWTPEHDDEHDAGELAAAACAYALAAADRQHPMSQGDGEFATAPPLCWPWAPEWWKSVDARRNLVKAGALTQAAIEQIDRAEARAAVADQTAEARPA